MKFTITVQVDGMISYNDICPDVQHVLDAVSVDARQEGTAVMLDLEIDLPGLVTEVTHGHGKIREE